MPTDPHTGPVAVSRPAKWTVKNVCLVC